MRNQSIHSPVVLDESVVLTQEEICITCKISTEQLFELVEHGILEPIGSKPQEWRFTAISLRRSITAVRLQRDLGINHAGVALALDLLEELEKLRARLAVFE